MIVLEKSFSEQSDLSSLDSLQPRYVSYLHETLAGNFKTQYDLHEFIRKVKEQKKNWKQET